MISDEWKTLAIQASIKAGKAILEIYNKDFEVIKKQDSSPLTQADLTAHSIITDILIKTGIPILSEEGREIPYDERKYWDVFWMVDPLDGTKEFVKRNGEFTVNIALISKNRPVFGVIYIPVLETLYAGGSVLEASFKIEIPSDTISWKELESSSHLLPKRDRNTFTQKRNNPIQKDIKRVVISRSHLDKSTELYIHSLQTADHQVSTVQAGSSLKFCLVAEDKADVYPRFSPCMEWDTAAGDAICEGAGVVVYLANTDKRLLYNKESLLSPNFEVY